MSTRPPFWAPEPHEALRINNEKKARFLQHEDGLRPLERGSGDLGGLSSQLPLSPFLLPLWL